VDVVLSVLLPINIYFLNAELRLPQLPVMLAVVSLVLAFSALACRYKSRLAAALFFIGGLALAFLWLTIRLVA
jgi:membrane-bound ClpP family serine protease